MRAKRLLWLAIAALLACTRQARVFTDAGAITLVVALSRYQFSPGGPDGPPIQLTAGATYKLVFSSVDVEHGVSSVPALGIAGSLVAPGVDYVVTVAPTEDQRGLYNFACTHVCGAEHGNMHGAIEVK